MGQETVWLNQVALVELFQISVPNTNKHLKNILQEEELRQDSAVKDFLKTATGRKNDAIRFSNLEAVFAVGNRVGA